MSAQQASKLDEQVTALTEDVASKEKKADSLQVILDARQSEWDRKDSSHEVDRQQVIDLKLLNILIINCYNVNSLKIVDSKFNQIIITPDTHFILDWHPKYDNVLLAGGCSGHLFKHGPVFGEFAAGVGTKQFGTPDRFKLGPRKKLSPKESPSGR